MKLLFLTLILLISTIIAPMASARGISEHLSYFNGAIDAFIQGPDQLSGNTKNSFTVTITDAQKNPYPYVTAKWVNATVAMTNMDMGSTKALVSDVLDSAGKPQGVLKIEPVFSMKGSWKLSLKLTTAAGSEINSITFDVAR